MEVEGVAGALLVGPQGLLAVLGVRLARPLLNLVGLQTKIMKTTSSALKLKLKYIYLLATLCFLKMVLSATCVLSDIQIVFIKRAYTEGTFFLNQLYTNIYNPIVIFVHYFTVCIYHQNKLQKKL